MTPTAEQAAIVKAAAAGEGLMVVARAGAAKTTTIELAAQALSAPRQKSAIALAFNKSIADTLAQRLPIAAKTMNALGFQAWGKVVGRCKLNARKLSDLRKHLSPAMPHTGERVVDLARRNGIVPPYENRHEGGETLPLAEWEELCIEEDLDPVWAEDCIALLRASIVQAFDGTIDFTDQLYMSAYFGGKFGKYMTVFVDEAQDLSPVDHHILSKIAQQLIAVGDPLQSIYAFRGADTSSMPYLQHTWNLQTLPLTMSFRCPKSVVKFCRKWAPDMQYPEWAADGQVLFDERRPDLQTLPNACTIICRNSAPLISLALKLGREVPVAFVSDKLKYTLLGFLNAALNYKRDVPINTIHIKLHEHLTQRTALTKRAGRKAALRDTYDALALCAKDARDWRDIVSRIDSLFSSPDANLIFSTGHGSKGLEWDTVVHLDPWRIPSPYATSPDAIQQEQNVAYVISTRAKQSLLHYNTQEPS